MRARTRIEALAPVLALLAVLLAAPAEATAARQRSAPGSSGGDPGTVEDGGKPAKVMLVCCQYRCSDANGDYLLVTCGGEACLLDGNLDRCKLLSRRDVASCKECKPRLDRGRGGEGGGCDGGGDAEPEGKGEPAAPPGEAAAAGDAKQH